MDQYMTGQEIAAEADYQAMLGDDATARAEMLAQCEAEAAEAAYFHAQREKDDIFICPACGLISPKCECDLATERKVNQRYPWPEDPAALSGSEAAQLCIERGKFRQQIGMKVAVSLLTVAALSFSVGLYTASKIIGDHVKQQTNQGR